MTLPDPLPLPGPTAAASRPLVYEVRKIIKLAHNQVRVDPGVTFQSLEMALKQLNELQEGKTIMGTNAAGVQERIPVPPLTDDDMARYIRIDAIVARQVGEYGEITPVRPQSATTPPKIGTSTFSQKEDDALEAAMGGQLTYPNQGGVKLGHNPANLAGKTLEELNGMCINEGGGAVQDQGGFDSVEKAVQFLTTNFKY